MNNKILFMIYNNEIKFLSDPNMDHRDWYKSLGGNLDEYDKVIRGFVINNQLIFFKGNLSYDNEVIDMARKCAPIMKERLNNPNLKVCCGINPGHDGSAWEPIMTLNDNELTGFTVNNSEEEKQRELERQININKPIEPILDFKNNYDDPKFIKFATIFTSVILVLTIISKIIMLVTEKLDFNTAWNKLLVLAQIAFLIVTIITYSKKNKKAKYFGLAASIALFFMFNILDIIIGIINLLFTIDQGYILNIISAGKKGVSKISNKK